MTYFRSYVVCYTLLCDAGLRIKENKEVYEGEVIELTPEETENQVRVASWTACA